jgi:hypothetical protein
MLNGQIEFFYDETAYKSGKLNVCGPMGTYKSPPDKAYKDLLNAVKNAAGDDRLLTNEELNESYANTCGEKLLESLKRLRGLYPDVVIRD